MSNLKELKEQVQQAKKEYKLAKKEQRQRARLEKKKQGNFLQRLSKKIDNFHLKVLEKFETKADDLRYKIDYPQDWEADIVVDNTQKILEKLQKKVVKGKELSEKDLIVLSHLSKAAEIIVDKELGKKVSHAEKLVVETKALIPKTRTESEEELDKEQVAALEGMIDQLNDMMASTLTNPAKA